MDRGFYLIKGIKQHDDYVTYVCNCIVDDSEIADQIVQYLNNTQTEYLYYYASIQKYDSLNEYIEYEE